MGNFAVDVMWRLGIGIHSRKGTRVGDLRLFLGSPSKFVQCIIFWCSLLDRLHPDYPPPSLIFCLPQPTDHTHYHFLYTTNARSLWTTHAILFFLLIGERKENTTAREFFFFPSEKLLGLTSETRLKPRNPLSRRRDYRWPALTPRR